MLTVSLPDEQARLPVIGVVGDDEVVVEVTGPLFSRTHTYRKGDFLRVRRGWNELQELWEAVGRWRPAPIPEPAPAAPKGKKRDALGR